MADILHEEIFSSLNFRVQSCPRVGGGGGQLPPLPPFSYTPLVCVIMYDGCMYYCSFVYQNDIVPVPLAPDEVVLVTTSIIFCRI